MSKNRSFRGGPKKPKSPLGGGGGGNMLAQVQKMQEQMAQTQEALAQEILTVTAGGGAVTVVITGHQRIQSITLDPEAINPEDIELLQEMLITAVNAAIEQSQAMAAQRMEGLTGGLGLGDLLGGL